MENLLYRPHGHAADQRTACRSSNSSPSDAAAKQWAAILHFSALAGFVFPFGNILAPLIVWQVKKAELPGLEAIGKSVMNFQISYMIYGIAATVIGIVGSCLYVPVALAFYRGDCLAGLHDPGRNLKREQWRSLRLPRPLLSFLNSFPVS